MLEAEFNQQIRSTWHWVSNVLGLGRAVVSMRSLPVDIEFRDVALSQESTYEQIYRTGLSRSNYNFLLQDYSYFQFSWSGKTSWRLGYFPNPWITGLPLANRELAEWEALEDMGDLSHEQVSELLAEMPYRGDVPTIRFEFAPDQYVELAHPAAHLHIGRHSQNRWASAVALGPVTFSLIIAKMYYGDAWAKCSSIHDSSVSECLDERLLSLVGELVAVADFSSKERRGLHFGKNIGVLESARIAVVKTLGKGLKPRASR